MAYRNLLVDLDGTLIDTAPGVTTSIRFAMQKLERPVAADLDLSWCIGPPFSAWFPILLKSQDPLLLQAAIDAYRERYAAGGMFDGTPFPGVLEALDRLDAAGYRMWVVTSKARPYAELVLQHFGLTRFFPRVYGPSIDDHVHTKFDLIREALIEQLVPVHETVMIGDRDLDIIAAKQNGMASIGVSWGYARPGELEAARPEAIVSSPDELVEVLS